MRPRTPRLLPLLIALAAAACTRPPTDTPAGPSSAPSTPLAPTPSAAGPGAAPAPTGTASGPRATDTFSTSLGDLQVTPIHHGSVLFTHAGKSVYVDPTSEGKLDGLPKADLVFITHHHGDHLDPAAVDALRKPETVVVGPASILPKIPGAVVMKNGETRSFGELRVLAFAMYNNKRGPSEGKLYHEKGMGNGYVFTFGDKKVYTSGDTECTDELRAQKDIDIAFLCMNLPYTMPPNEAAECVKEFRPKIVFPYHHRGSDPGVFQTALAGTPGVEVRIRDWY
jgi:L-ascorbate metabolism protein UlaG (beta-lactamase superfamily)